MKMSSERFVYVTYIASTPGEVWQALLEGEITRQYWKCENISDWTPGAKWQLVADNDQRSVLHIGEVLENLPEKRLALSWADPADAGDPSRHSRLYIDIETVGDMVRLTITHDQLTPEMQQKITLGWPRVLSSLKSFLETGKPLDTWA
jgi:uncharacterized protein YndB with AHSA1/START domain